MIILRASLRIADMEKISSDHLPVLETKMAPDHLKMGLLDLTQVATRKAALRKCKRRTADRFSFIWVTVASEMRNQSRSN